MPPISAPSSTLSSHSGSFLHPTPEPLSATQTLVVAALAAGQSITAAAAAAQVHRSTVHLWLKDSPAFAQAVETARSEAARALEDQLLDLAAVALATLRDALTSPGTSPAARIRAALGVLAHTRRLAASRRPAPAPPIDAAPAAKPFVLNDADLRELVRQTALRPPPPAPDIPRSAPCPCGSGEKYKRCCGRHAPPVLNLPV